jgi:hypothetical protein
VEEDVAGDGPRDVEVDLDVMWRGLIELELEVEP